MSINSFGHLFRMTTWGESHGPSIGAVVDGCPPKIPINEKIIQNYLDKRRPGQSKFTTQRKEKDEVKILSGVFDGKTTGTPIQLQILNTDNRTKDYDNISKTFRPGHADLTYHLKYGIRDHRGGGRSSARETASRVAAGAIAFETLKKLIPNIKILGYLKQIGKHKIDKTDFDLKEVNKNPFFSPSVKTTRIWEKYLTSIRKKGDSVGAIIEVIVKGVPPGLGAPIYAKLDSDIARGIMSINAVKSIEIGNGIEAAYRMGSENADEIFNDENGISFNNNNSGGILGGISTGQDIILRFSVKPTSSILIPKKSINKEGKSLDIITKGRHDPCVGIRAVPVAEAMLSCIILDHFLLNKAQNSN